LAITFDGSASSDAEGPIAAYAWSFGPLATATGTIATYTFTTPGNYTVTLQVTDGQGLTGGSAVNIRVPRNPVARFTRTPGGGPGPLLVSFNATQSFDPDDGIVGYHWDFGDGTEDATSGSQVQHTFSADGVYPVNLLLTDGDGHTGTITENVTVTPANLPPEVDAGPDITQGESDRFVVFNGSADDPDGSLSSVSWDLGDGSSEDGAEVSHTYAAKGVYVARLTATDDMGESMSDEATVTITNVAPAIDLSSFPARVVPGAERLYNLVASDPLDDLSGTVAWGDGSSAARAANKSRR
jgi:PKD repeat protein